MAKTVCAFCAQPNKISAEHIWGRWIGPLLGMGTLTLIDKIMGDTEPTGARHRIWEEPAGRNISFGSPELSHRVKAPCEPCNNGWMSKLETDVAPIITPMIQGSLPIGLTAEFQLLLARWITKTAMMCEYLGPVRYFAGDERRSMMEDKRPPDDVCIWIGHSQAPHAIQGSNLHLAPPQMTAPAAYLVTHAIGQFAFQLFAYRPLLAETNYVRVRSGPWEQSLFPIWPKNDKPLEWPPPLTLTRQRWKLFTERFVGFASPPP
jgi:hypothetical protein